MFDDLGQGEFDVLTDILFNALVGFAFLFFVAFAMINPEAKTGEIDTDVEILITVTWPEGLEDDIDVYVEDPLGNLVWYNRREAGLMHLDRDDRGQFRDVLLVNGVEVASPLNQETVSVRGLVDGEYVVNVVHFIAAGLDPVPVTVKVEKMNPSVRVVFYGDVTLTGTGDERTVVRFTLTGDEIEDVNDRPKSLVAATRESGSRAPGGDLDPGTGEVAAMTGTILGLSVAYGLVAVVTALLALSRPVPLVLRAGLTVAVAVLIFVTYRGIGEIRGLPSDSAPPERFRLLWGQVVEPDKLTGEPGHVYLWINELDPEFYPVGLPRAHMLPYTEDLAATVEAALAQVSSGEQVAGEIEDRPEFSDTAERLAAEVEDTGSDGNATRVGERVLTFDFGDLSFGTAPAPVTPEKRD